MTGLLSLPTELLNSIVLYTIDSGASGPTGVSRLSLTCRRLHGITIPVLYRHIQAIGCSGLKNLCATLRKPNLAIHVKGLEIRRGVQRTGSKAFDGSVVAWQRLDLPALPNCYSLEVDAYLTHRPEGYTGVAIPLTMALKWANSCKQLVRIRFLELRGATKIWKRPVLIFPATLIELDININADNHSYQTEALYLAVIKMLPSITRLTIRGFSLVYYRDPSVDFLTIRALRPFLCLGKGVKSLTLRGHDSDKALIPEISNIFPRLESLGCSLVHTVRKNASLNLPHLRSLNIHVPRTWELDEPYFNSHSLQYFIQTLELGLFPRLQKLNFIQDEVPVYRRHNTMPSHPWSKATELISNSLLPKACSMRGIQLSTTED